MLKSNAVEAFLAGLLAAAATLVINQAGLVYSWDSKLFLLFSDMFAQGYLDRDSSYAPLFMWSLGSLRLVLSDFNLSINVYIFLTWFSFFFLINKSVCGALLPGLVAFLAIFGNPVMLRQLSYVLTEPAYSVLLAIAFVSMLAVASQGLVGSGDRTGEGPRGWELAFLVSLAMLPLQRYVGGFAVVFLGAAYLAGAPGLARLRNLAIASTPTLLILFWNFRATGYLSGYREPSRRSFAENLQTLADSIVGEFRLEFALYLLLVVLLGVLWFRDGRKAGRLPGPGFALVALLIVLAIPAPLVLQAHTASIVSIDPISTRFVVAVVPAIYAGLLWAIAKLVRPYGRRWRFGRELVWLVVLAALLPFAPRFQWEIGEALREHRTYPEVRDFLERVGPGEVALVAGGTRHMLADDILLNRFTGDVEPCARFRTRGSFWDSSFHFATRCNAQMPSLHPVALDQWQDLDRRFSAAIVAVTDLDSDKSAELLDSLPECADVEAIENLTLVDLRRCRSPSAG